MPSPRLIGVKAFREQFKTIARSAQRGNSFVVTFHNKPLFRIEPIQKRKAKFSKKDLLDIHFSDPNEGLSKQIDTLLYDV